MTGREIVLHEAFGGRLSLEEVAEATGIHPELVVRFMEFGLVDPVGEEEGRPLFPPTAIPRLRAAYRLRCQMGVNLPGIALILELQEEIARLRGELARWRKIYG